MDPRRQLERRNQNFVLGAARNHLQNPRNYVPAIANVLRYGYRNRETLAAMARNTYRAAQYAANRLGSAFKDRGGFKATQGVSSGHYGGQRSGGGGYRRFSKTPFRKSWKGKKTFSQSSLKTMAQALKLSSWKSQEYKSFRKLESSTNRSSFWGWDVGLGSIASTLNNTHNIKVGTSQGGDISTFFQDQFGLLSNGFNRLAEWKSSLHLTLKNQHNFGVWLKLYYIKTPQAGSVTNEDTMQDIAVVFYGAPAGGETITQAHDITANPGIPAYLTITHRRMIKLLPGETITLKLKASSWGPKNLSSMCYKTRNKFTRSLLVQATGFPVHKTADEFSIANSQVSIDCIALHKVKGRIADSIAQGHIRTATNVTIGAVTDWEGQQIQAGAPMQQDA